jgi:tRNA nucleotidyltransferase (CCA-adding enzyme)
MAVLFPELAPMIGFEQRSAYHSKTTDEHTFDAVQAAANMQANHAPLRVRLALLFHDAGKPHTAWIGRDGRAHYYARRQGVGTTVRRRHVQRGVAEARGP